MARLFFFSAGADDAPALLDDGADTWISYRELEVKCIAWKERLQSARQAKALVFLYADQTVESVAGFIGAIMAGHAVALLDPKLSTASRDALDAAYRPDFVVDMGTGDAHSLIARDFGTRHSGQIHPDVAVLLSTSGSTGSPKFVKLSLAALDSNANAIAAVLDIRPDDVACGYLPIHYSYGLSVLVSHLAVGARVALTGLGFMEAAFWQRARELEITHLPGIPFHHEMMQRLSMERLHLDQLRTLTQAGGRLSPRLLQAAHAYMEKTGGRFYVMYGQTEAAPRITTLPHEDFPAHPDSVGAALPGGHLSVRDEEGNELPTGREGHVFYSGPNVMLGYADNRDGLAGGDDLSGELDTGDIGFLDEAGRLTVSGRAKRFAKLYGLRVNLDEIQNTVQSLCEAAVVEVSEKIVVYSPDLDASLEKKLHELLTDRSVFPETAFSYRFIESIPRTERGKIDYKELERRNGE